MDGTEKQIILVEDAYLGSLAISPEDVIGRATAIAKPLGQMILDRKLFTQIADRKYVRVEGWTTLGAMLGVLPREVSVIAIPDGYEARIDLIRARDGMVIGGASAVCLKTEKRWATAPEYAVRSMAVTRATGKAFRLGFSWIIKLAGDYEPTPAEEMEPTEVEVPSNAEAKTWPPGRIEEVKVWLIDAKVIPENTAAKHVLALLDLSPFTPTIGKKDLIAWGKLYRGFRDEELKPKEAAERANELWRKEGAHG